MPIVKSKCKKPRRWITQRSLRSSRPKSRCQTFSKRKQDEPIRAITKGWVSRMAHNENIRSSGLLSEEVRYKAIGFIRMMLTPPNTIGDIRAKIPRGLKGGISTEYALSEVEFMNLVIITIPEADVDDDILNLLHKSMESYLYQLFSKGAMLAKTQGDKSLQPKHITQIHYQYFPQAEADVVF